MSATPHSDTVRDFMHVNNDNRTITRLAEDQGGVTLVPLIDRASRAQRVWLRLFEHRHQPHRFRDQQTEIVTATPQTNVTPATTEVYAQVTSLSNGSLASVPTSDIADVSDDVSQPEDTDMAIVDDEHPINEAAHTNDLHLSQTPNTTIATHFPPIGSDYDFVEPQNWPADIVYLKYNVFEGSQPFPVSHQSSSYNSKCGCDYHRCIPANTTRLTSRCVNAGMDLICDATTCSGGQTCGNRFEQCFVLDLIATKVGFGVVCNTTIPNGSFVIEYVGEVLLRDAALNRYDRRYQVELKAKTTWGKRVALFIDARNGGNESRFINHCCEPNCALYEYQWTNTVRLGIFATSDIPPLQELTFRYREENISLFECQCSRTSCVSQLE